MGEEESGANGRPRLASSYRFCLLFFWQFCCLACASLCVEISHRTCTMCTGAARPINELSLSVHNNNPNKQQQASNQTNEAGKDSKSMQPVKKNDNCSKFFTGIEGWLFLLVKQQHEHLDPQQRAVPVSVRNHHSCCELLPPNSSETLLGKSVRCSAISR